jgi:hypothetical protein
MNKDRDKFLTKNKKRLLLKRQRTYHTCESFVPIELIPNICDTAEVFKTLTTKKGMGLNTVKKLLSLYTLINLFAIAVFLQR